METTNLSTDEQYKNEYNNYVKPPLSPPNYIFGIVWPILYITLIIGYGQLFTSHYVLILLNVLCNVSYTYVQFRIKNYSLALALILVMIITHYLILYYNQTYYILYPYFIWLCYAFYLQTGVLLLNK